MDKFVKVENEMWKMPAKERIQTRIVSASAAKRVLDLLFRFAQPPTCRCLVKNEKPINYAAIILITEMWQNISGETSDYYIWKLFPYLDQHRLHLWTHTFCNVACQVRLPCASDCNLQSQLHCAVTAFEQNFTKLVSDSIRCFIIGEWNYLFK